ncbi:hypothetical protein EG68_07159 [Paragonimus skrjabini miyazakii]|uniref:C2H2-type domain-containing protein n=1 Tax=Paragonimus skrjabini miyazakii TaxID=59628 RepID=A0A8S9YMP3_9TREM|nr:hypothetical protein EG68_07159 [Paragonimus skrjabini miyazakii]
MEIGPELCLWTGGNQAVQKESDSRSHYCPPFSGLPSNQTQPSRSSQFAGVVLELESDSDLESEDDEQWDANETLEIFRNDLRNTAIDSVITLEIPAESKTTCHTTPVDSEPLVQVSLEDPLDTCISLPQESDGQNRNASTTSSNKKIGSKELSPSVLSLSQQDDHSTRIATRSSEISNTNTISIENSGDKNLTESDSVDRNTPLGPLVLQTLTSSIQCPKCQRYFVDRRSMNIHSTKAHSGKRTTETKSHPVSVIDSDRVDETANRSSGTIDDNISPISNRVEGSARSSQCSPIGPIQTAADKPGDFVPPSGLAAPTPPSSPAASVSSSSGSAATKQSLSPTSYGVANLPKRRISYTVSSSAVPLSDSGSLKLRLVSVASAKRSKLLEASPQPPHAHKMDLLESKSTPILESQELDGSVCVSSTPEKYVEMMDCTMPNQTTESPCSSSGKQPSNVQFTQIAVATEQTKEREVDAAANTRINRLKRLRTLSRPRTRSTRTKITRVPLNVTPIETSRTGGPRLKADVPVVKSNRLPAASQSEKQTSSSSRPILDTSLRTADGSYRCRLCKRVFPNRFSLTGHYKSHYVESQKPYHCEDCEQRYTSPSNLHYHRSRNCPFVKLREMNNGASVARSPRSMKLIQAKIKRINERRAILHQFELSDSTSAKMPAEMKEQPIVTVPSSETPASSNLKVLSDRSDSILLEPCTQTLPTPQESKIKEAHSDPQLTTSNEIVVCSRSSSEPKTRNLSPNRILNSPKRVVSKVPSVSDAPSSCKTGSRQVPVPISSASSESTNCNVNPPTAHIANAERELSSDLNSPTLQLQLKNLLERACQSDLARERILAFTSAALLSALGPLANSKTQQNGCVAENLKKIDTNVTTLPTSLLANFTELLHMTNSTGQPDHEGYDCDETDVERSESWRRPDSSSTNSVSSSIPARPSPILQVPANTTSASPMTTSLRPQITDLNNRSYSCPYFCHPRAVFPDPQSLDKHIFQTHSSRLHPTRTPPLLSVPSSNPQPYDLHQIIGFNCNSTQRPPILSPLRSEASNHKLASRDDLVRSVSDSPCLVACTECDRLFSSFTACRVHYTKSHQNSNRSRPPTITITELGASGQQPVKFRWHDHQPDGKR